MRTYPPPLRALAICLAILAGFVDAIAYLQLGGFFVSFMSGNSTRLGVGLTSSVAAAQMAASLIAAFIFGVLVGSLVARRTRSRQRPAVLGLVTLLLASAGAAQASPLPVLGALCLAAAMGAENAVFERDGQATFGLTYMTGALVKVGQGLASALTGGDRWGWTAFALLWLGLVGGASAGAWAYALMGGAAVWIAAASAGLLGLVSTHKRFR